MKITYISIAVLSLTSALNSKASETISEATPRVIDKLVREAVATHPKAEAARQRTEAARSAIQTVRLWQDPQIGLGYMFANKMMQRDDGDVIASFDQTLPRVGLYKAEKRKAFADFEAQGRAVAVTANELGLSVAQAALELALADEIISLQAENIRWLETIVSTAKERAKNPDASATETLRLQGELSMRQQSFAVSQRLRAQYARNLNILLGRNQDAEWKLLSLPLSVPALPSTIALKVKLERSNPRLAELRYMAQGASADADAAKEKKKPVFSFGVQANSYSGGNLRSTMVGVKMSLPWLNHSAYRADIAKAEQLRQSAESDIDGQLRQLNAELTALITDAENNRQLVKGYDTEVLPRTGAAVETLQNAWISSKATLLEVLDARRALLDAKQEQKRALAAQHVAIHSIAALTGSLVKISSK